MKMDIFTYPVLKTWTEPPVRFELREKPDVSTMTIAYLTNPTIAQAKRAIFGVRVLHFSLVFEGDIRADVRELARQYSVPIRASTPGALP